MAVAIARTSALRLTGSTAVFLVVGPFPAGLWIPSLTILLNSNTVGTFDVSPVLSRVDEASAEAHRNGRALLDVGEVVSNRKAAVQLEVAAAVLMEFPLPVGLLVGSGPIWLLVRASHTSVSQTGRVIVSAMGVPFEGATLNRRAGDGDSALGGPTILPPPAPGPRAPLRRGAGQWAGRRPAASRREAAGIGAGAGQRTSSVAAG